MSDVGQLKMGLQLFALPCSANHCSRSSEQTIFWGALVFEHVYTAAWVRKDQETYIRDGVAFKQGVPFCNYHVGQLYAGYPVGGWNFCCVLARAFRHHELRPIALQLGFEE